ncbi:hypothetical protein B0O99DRAFT_595896 [Bisporella sp. PMI_857]|nr:hypothetical protein B0O99DRAFT_595896 [Bisporella sp. PMI_857]
MQERAYDSGSTNQMEISDFSAPNPGSVEAGNSILAFVRPCEPFWPTPIAQGGIISAHPYAAGTYSVLGNGGLSHLDLVQWNGIGVTKHVATPSDALQHTAFPNGNGGQSLPWYSAPNIPTPCLLVAATRPEWSNCNDFQVDAQRDYEAEYMGNPSINYLNSGLPLHSVYIQTPTLQVNPEPEALSFLAPPIQATAPASASFQPLGPIASINPPTFNCHFCMQSFTRDADRIRHENTTHLGNLGQLYLCPVPGCVKSQGNGYSRADKVTEHLWKKHANLGYVKRT